jgi:cell division control protein 24
MLMSGAPLSANTIGNKPAVAGSSLYQACLTLRDRLWCVTDFGEAFLVQSVDSPTTNEAGSSASIGGYSSAPASPKTTHIPSKAKVNPSDPVTQLWQCFRLGAPLCWLFNKLGPRNELPINPDANRSNANECKKQVAKFIIALNHELGWDSDDIFTVSQLYLNDTNGFVKVIRTISKLLDVFESRGLLNEAPTSAITEELQKPSDDRAWIVRELLDTERKYVQDLEVMQNYARALSQYDILPPDTIHSLFGNLNTLVDVQRRFLICVEENVRRPADDQHFGHVFQIMVSLKFGR